MRKQLIRAAHAKPPRADEEDWLDLEALADVEVSSEEAAHPIEAALLASEGGGWRAGGPGKQTILLSFKPPQRIHRIRLEFVESRAERTQEYVLRALLEGEPVFREIVRQQWNFSPRGSNVEIEDHRVELARVAVLELAITPDIGDERAYASLAKLRMA